MVRRSRLGLACVLVLASAGVARAALYETEKFKLSADFRVRLEVDWDSKNAAGVERDDRGRLRARFRVGFRYDHDDHLTVAARLRSGSDDSQQSPHITLVDFNDNDTGDSDFNLDRWYASYHKGTFWTWLGRNDFPFWRPTEFLWDDDVTLVGAALGGVWKLDRREMRVTGGYFTLPVGMQASSGNLAAAQIVHRTTGKKLDSVVAAGFYNIDPGDRDLDAEKLLTGNGFRDYTVVALSGQLRKTIGKRPATLGLELMQNLEDYDRDAPDPFTAANHDETDGYSISAIYGNLSKKNNWLVAYLYARIEALAVAASYAQDDWVRWGTPPQTRASNLKGHELRYARAVADNANVVARLFLVESVTTAEDGNRFRLDLNVRF